MRERIPASERTGQRIRALLAGGSAEDVRLSFVELAVRRLIEEAAEAEVRDLLGRGPYERRVPPPDAASEADGVAGDRRVGARPRGYRNGVRPGRIKTAEGEVEYSAPQVTGTDEPFRSKVREALSGRTEALERLAVEMYARGLSTRDIEAAFRDESSGESVLSRTAVSEISERLWKEYEAFATRDLSEYKIAYLFLDGIAERLHAGTPREPVLCAWGIDFDGKKHLIHLAPGTKEDTENVRALLQDLKRRGLRDPLLVATDGAGGLIKGVEEVFPRSLRQRCLAHKIRNLCAKVPEDQWKEVKAHALAAYQAPSPELARSMRQHFLDRYQRSLPSAAACFDEDFEACIAHLRFPVGHRRAVRTTNMLERLFVEERRRTKIVPNAFGEKPMLKLMYAATIRASATWKPVRVTLFERQQLEAIEQELSLDFKNRTKAAVSRPTPSTLSSKIRA